MNTSYLDIEAFCDITLCSLCSFDIFVVVFTEFTSTEREQLAFCLGKYQKDSIVKDCVE